MIEEEKVRAGPGGTPFGRPYGKGESRTRGSPFFFEPLAGGPNRSPRSPLWGDGRGGTECKAYASNTAPRAGRIWALGREGVAEWEVSFDMSRLLRP
jgi:hypothetical protein